MNEIGKAQKKPEPRRGPFGGPLTQQVLKRLHQAEGLGPEAFNRLWGELHAHHDRRLRSYARRHLNGAIRLVIEPEDISNEVWGRAFQNWRSLRADAAGTFFGWLCLLARRIIVDGARRLRHAPRITPLPEELLEDHRSFQSPVENAMRRALAAEITTQVASLPEHQATALRACLLEAVPVREFARRLGVLPNTLAVRLHRGRAFLRRRLLPRVQSLL
jgi:RNA polymerase sigma factor (sigma-70 family)